MDLADVQRRYRPDPRFAPGLTPDSPQYHADCEPGGVLITLGRNQFNHGEMWFEVSVEDVGAVYLPVAAITGILEDAGLV